MAGLQGATRLPMEMNLISYMKPASLYFDQVLSSTVESDSLRCHDASSSDLGALGAPLKLSPVILCRNRTIVATRQGSRPASICYLADSFPSPKSRSLSGANTTPNVAILSLTSHRCRVKSDYPVPVPCDVDSPKSETDALLVGPHRFHFVINFS